MTLIVSFSGGAVASSALHTNGLIQLTSRKIHPHFVSAGCRLKTTCVKDCARNESKRIAPSSEREKISFGYDCGAVRISDDRYVNIAQELRRPRLVSWWRCIASQGGVLGTRDMSPEKNEGEQAYRERFAHVAGGAGAEGEHGHRKVARFMGQSVLLMIRSRKATGRDLRNGDQQRSGNSVGAAFDAYLF
ncbi:hypothetical protein FGB62_15g221 [Gracilaria domingensis]|nr:hypothetical protein FGB62_15g221 [Gracilaria domingensis]